MTPQPKPDKEWPADLYQQVMGQPIFPPLLEALQSHIQQLQHQQEAAVLQGQIKQLDTLYKGGLLGQWDYDRIKLKLTQQLNDMEENHGSNK